MNTLVFFYQKRLFSLTLEKDMTIIVQIIENEQTALRENTAQ